MAESRESTLPVAGVAEILGPYQTEPFRAFDETLIRSLGEECATAMKGGLPLQPELDLADGRGGGRILLVYGAGAGEHRRVLRKDQSGRDSIVDSTGASTGTAPVQLGPLELAASSGGSASERIRGPTCTA